MIYVYYHRNCYDGVLAAAVYTLHAGRLGFLLNKDYVLTPWGYGDEIPYLDQMTVRDNVVLLDLTFDEVDLERVADMVNHVTVIDHHPRAYQQVKKYKTGEGTLSNVDFVTDSEENRQSGAQLTWNYYIRLNQHQLVRWIGKSDLWIFDEPEIQKMRRACCTLGFDVRAWRSQLEKTDMGPLLRAGEAISSSYESQLDYLEANSCSRMMIAGYNVITVDAPKFLASEIAERIYSKTPIEDSMFVAVHYEEHRKLVYSLRSRKDCPIHLGDLCAKFGGGGHQHAAGFKVNIHKAPLEPFQPP